MTENSNLPVLATAVSAWRLIVTRPRYVLRTGWLPALVIFGVAAAFSGDTGASGPNTGQAFWAMIAALLNFALLVLALVAWQRSALPGAKLRKGTSTLRLGRAELLAAAHFPLVGAMFVPISLPGLIENLSGFSNLGELSRSLPLSAVLIVLLIFPGGLLLTRAALILVAIAEAGGQPVPLVDTGNRVWRAGAGASIRLFLLFYLAVLPVVAVMAVLPDTLPAVAQAALRGVLLTLYIFAGGGALSVAYAALGGAPARKP